jgi:hypothetical protein
MPLEGIRAVLRAPDVETRNALIAAHLGRLEDELARTRLYEGAPGELRGTPAAQGVTVLGPPGGILDETLFTEERGRATLFLPCDRPVRPVGRVVPLRVPAVELATITHVGPEREIDRPYGTLAGYVARDALAVQGPIRASTTSSTGTTPRTRAAGAPRWAGRSSRSVRQSIDHAGRVPLPCRPCDKGVPP